MLVQQAFDAVIDSMTARYGDNVAGWNWGRVQDTYVPHLISALKPFGRFHLNAPGCALCVNSTKPRNGPSWRMVVALHPNPDSLQAFGLYPGGQSGNPGSPWYDDMIDQWVAGNLFPLWFMRTAADSRRSPLSQWKLTPLSS
jgi:penicillin amidase